jgi:hypothetical protein
MRASGLLAWTVCCLTCVSATRMLQAPQGTYDTSGISVTNGFNTDCGNWASSYTKLHAQLLRGDLPERWAIATGHNGLAGRYFFLG